MTLKNCKSIFYFKNSHFFITVISLFISVFMVSFKKADQKTTEKKPLRFEIIYESLQPIKIERATLHISPDKLLGKTDSFPMYFSKDKLFFDTLLVNYTWDFPVHAWVKLKCSDKFRISNKFFLDPLRGTWIINIADSTAKVVSKPKLSFEDKESYQGIILLLQILLELILASLLVRFFRWPAWVILVVLVSNIAAFPVFMMNLQPHFLTDIAMLFLKFLVIFLTGRKRLGIARIIILVITLSIISFGFKEIFLVISEVL